jgi:hypothetical protein
VPVAEDVPGRKRGTFKDHPEKGQLVDYPPEKSATLVMLFLV